jgi:hypothetical protein
LNLRTPEIIAFSPAWTGLKITISTFCHGYNISGQPPNTGPTNGVFGVKIPQFIVVRKRRFFYNFCT